MMGRGDWVLLPHLQKKHILPLSQWKKKSLEAKQNHVLRTLSQGTRGPRSSAISEDPETHFRVPHQGGIRKYALANRFKRSYLTFISPPPENQVRPGEQVRNGRRGGEDRDPGTEVNHRAVERGSAKVEGAVASREKQTLKVIVPFAFLP